MSGFSYEPIGGFYDAESTMGGPGGGTNATILSSDVQMSLSYFNGHNYQQVYNAFNFGSDTGEGVSNATSIVRASSQNGSLSSEVAAGLGTLGPLYYRSQVGILNVQTGIPSGTLYVNNASFSGSSYGAGYPFIGGDVNVTLSPGTYDLIMTGGGTQTALNNVVLSAGKYISLNINGTAQRPSPVPITLAYSSLGGNITSPPLLTIIQNGTTHKVSLTTTPTVYNVDKGTLWNVTSVVGSGTERWLTTQSTSGNATTAQSVNLVFYHQFQLLFNYNVSGGGSGYQSPAITYYSLGAPLSSPLNNAIFTAWTDSGSTWTVPSVLQGSTANERWVAMSGSGNVSTSGIVNITYVHQYAVTINAPADSWISNAFRNSLGKFLGDTNNFCEFQHGVRIC